jgi:hypothetical protein
VTLQAAHVGSEGFVRFVKRLHRLGVIDHDELLDWLRLRGCVVRAIGQPLEDGGRIDEQGFAQLAFELGAECE